MALPSHFDRLSGRPEVLLKIMEHLDPQSLRAFSEAYQQVADLLAIYKTSIYKRLALNRLGSTAIRLQPEKAANLSLPVLFELEFRQRIVDVLVEQLLRAYTEHAFSCGYLHFDKFDRGLLERIRSTCENGCWIVWTFADIAKSVRVAQGVHSVEKDETLGDDKVEEMEDAIVARRVDFVRQLSDSDLLDYDFASTLWSKALASARISLLATYRYPHCLLYTDSAPWTNHGLWDQGPFFLSHIFRHNHNHGDPNLEHDAFSRHCNFLGLPVESKSELRRRIEAAHVVMFDHALWERFTPEVWRLQAQRHQPLIQELSRVATVSNLDRDEVAEAARVRQWFLNSVNRLAGVDF